MISKARLAIDATNHYWLPEHRAQAFSELVQRCSSRFGAIRYAARRTRRFGRSIAYLRQAINATSHQVARYSLHEIITVETPEGRLDGAGLVVGRIPPPPINNVGAKTLFSVKKLATDSARN